MQKFLNNLYQTEDFALSRANISQNVSAQDLGLGISTDENDCADVYQTTAAAHNNVLGFDDQQQHMHATDFPKLASPFDERPYMAVPGWNGSYSCSTLSDDSHSAYAPAPDSHFLRPHNASGPTANTMSPSDYSHEHFECSTPHQGQIRRPTIRHNSASSPVLETNMYSYGTPTVEISSFQETPHSATSEWQDINHYLGDHQMVADYSPYDSMEPSPQAYRPQQKVRAIMTVPSRRKPHLRPSLSESCVSRMNSPATMRPASTGYLLQAGPYDQYMTTLSVQQLPLPPLPPSVLINMPQLSQRTSVLPGTPASECRQNRSSSDTPQRRKQPSSPPPSDFGRTNMLYLTPVRQEPAFAGDLYTPRYKRRTTNGRWEGWCGYCSPGRWLDLKNSRFWEDKLRNHGICAKSKMRFEEPEEIRWVSSDGSVFLEDGSGPQSGDPIPDQRKREGLCGVCKTWVGMDGLRTKARDRAVGWWMHAYKCHDHDKAVEQQQTGI